MKKENDKGQIIYVSLKLSSQGIVCSMCC